MIKNDEENFEDVLRWSYTKKFFLQRSEDFFMINCCIIVIISKNATLLNAVAIATKIWNRSKGNWVHFKT